MMMHPIALRRFTSWVLLCTALGLPALADDAAGPRRPVAGDTCPVCGMRVAPHTAWIAQVIFADDSALFFDGSKDLFKYLLARDDYLPARSGLHIAAIFVTSYYRLEVIPAADALFVIGSDVYGPMGPELIPHPTLAEAEEFLRDHGGRQIVHFDQVTAELLRAQREADAR